MKSKLTEIVCIADRSGSMASVIDDAIGGFNSFLKKQKKLPGKCDFSLVMFDDRYEYPVCCKNIKKVTPLNRDTYVPRGMTALLDAIGKTINNVDSRLAALKKSKRPNVMVVIITDGQENASREFNRQQIFDMIKNKREEDKWEFVYLAANQDAIAQGTSMGINLNFNYCSTPVGTAKAYNAIHAASASYRCCSSVNTGAVSAALEKDE